MGFNSGFKGLIETLVNLQLDAQNSCLFTYNTFIKILYMFRALPCSSSGGLRRNCIHMQPLVSSLCTGDCLVHRLRKKEFCVSSWRSTKVIQGDSVARGPKLLSICATQANASHWTSPMYRGGVHAVFHRFRYVYINFQVIISIA